MPPRHDFHRDRGQTEPHHHGRHRQQRGAAELDQRQQWPIGLTEGHQPPGKAAEREDRLQPFLRRPDQRKPDRPSRQSAHHDGQQAEDAGKQRTYDRQRQPGNRTYQIADPRQQRQIKRQSEQKSVPQAARRSRVGVDQHPSQQRGSDDGAPPPVQRREAGIEQRPAHDAYRQPHQTGQQRSTWPWRPADPPGSRRPARPSRRQLRVWFLRTAARHPAAIRRHRPGCCCQTGPQP